MYGVYHGIPNFGENIRFLDNVIQRIKYPLCIYRVYHGLPIFEKRRNTFLPFMMQHKEEKHMNLRTNCGRRFTTIGTDSTTISSACTYAPSSGLEGVTQIIPLSLYNNPTKARFLPTGH